MANYTPPNITGLPFNFTPGGYSPPSFGSVPLSFSYRPQYSLTSNLNSAIQIMGLYKDSTYTYLKECPKIIIGYGPAGIQTLRLPCIYGGIRDIGGYIYANPPNVDLNGYIFCQSNFMNLIHYIKPTIPTNVDLPNTVRGWSTGNYFDIFNTIRPWYIDNHKDLTSLLSGWDLINLKSAIRAFVREVPFDLRNTIRVWDRGNSFNLPNYLKQCYTDTKDLPVYLKQVYEQPYDFISRIRGWSLENEVNLINTIRPWYRENQFNLPSYLKQTFPGHVDLSAYVKDCHPANLDISAFLHGWQEVMLPGYLLSMQYRDLSSLIVIVGLKELTSIINTIEPVNISSSIHGWAVLNLPSILIGVYGPYDIQSKINSIRPVNIKSIINALKGVEVEIDLISTIESYYSVDLVSLIDVIESIDLVSYINATGDSTYLESKITPKVVYIKNFIPINLLDHRDLFGMINIACFGSGYRDILSYVNAQYKLDLRGYIFPVHGGNIVNLKSYINMGTGVFVEDKIRIGITIPNNTVSIPITTRLVSDSLTFDSIKIRFGHHASMLLSSYINSIPFTFYSDLSSRINAVINRSFNLRSPGQQIKHKEIVINLLDGEPRWQREVEIAFKESALRYYYFSGSQEAYKDDIDDRWSIRIEGFDRISGGAIDRGKVRSKYLFNLNKYNTIDELITDAIDRVSMFRRFNLASTITPHGGFRNLSSYIRSEHYFYNTPLQSIIKACGDDFSDLSTDIYGSLHEGLSNFGSQVIPNFNQAGMRWLKLTIDSSKIDKDLVNFPVGIMLNHTSGISDYDATCLFDELVDTPGGGGPESFSYVNIESNGTATASSFFEEYGPGNVVSGTGSWKPDGSTTSSWWMVELVEDKLIYEVYISCTNTYRLWASTDGVDWTELLYDSGSQTYKVYTRLKYARLDVYGSSSPVLSSFKLYGKEPTGSVNELAIVMYTSDGSFVFLPTEIAYWDCINKNAYLWTKVPTVSSDVDTELFLYYGNNVTYDYRYVDYTGTEVAQSVWDDYFKVVYHMSTPPLVGNNIPVSELVVPNSASDKLHGVPSDTMVFMDWHNGSSSTALPSYRYDTSDNKILSVNTSGIYDLDFISDFTVEAVSAFTHGSTSYYASVSKGFVDDGFGYGLYSSSSYSRGVLGENSLYGYVEYMSSEHHNVLSTGDDFNALYMDGEVVAQLWFEQQKFQASNTESDAQFGCSVDIYGDTAIVGAHYEDVVGSDSGAAYIFTISGSTWSQQQKIQSDDLEATDYFGHSVSIYDDTAVVGAYSENTGATSAGAVYIFTRSGSTWTQQQKIQAHDLEPSDCFGYYVSIYEDTIIVCAYAEDTGGVDAGAAYIFTRIGTTWTEQQKIQPLDIQAGDRFGNSASIYADTVIVGAYCEDTGAADAGSAYIFTRSGSVWTEQQKIQASDRQADDYFGTTVAVYEDTVIVGSHAEDTGGIGAGAAYIFTRSGSMWTEQQKIMASDQAALYYFGWSVDLYADTAIVGAHREGTGGTNAGASYIFTRSGSTWIEQRKIVASDPAANDYFGHSVSIYSNTAIIGAWGEDTGTSNAGSAYLFTRSGLTVSNTQNYDLIIGNALSNHTLSPNDWVGTIGEVRISSPARSDEWIKATYYSNFDDLITYTGYITTASGCCLLIIDRFKIDEPLTDFPIAISVEDSFGSTIFDALHGDRRKQMEITTVVSGVETQLPVEISSWDYDNMTGVVWTKVPTVASGVDTELIFRYNTTWSGNTDYVGFTGDAVAQGVWDSNFKGVWHMEQDPSGGPNCILDSTYNENHGTPNGGMDSDDLVDGTVGKALDFDGTNDYVEVDSPYYEFNTNNELTVSWLVDVGAFQIGAGVGQSTSNTDSMSTNVWLMHGRTDGTITWYVNDNGSWRHTSIGNIYNDPHYVVGTASFDNLIMYVDGVAVSSGTGLSSGIRVNSNSVIHMGKDVRISSNRWLNGVIDEVCVSNNVQSPAWIKASYYSNCNNLITYYQGCVEFDGSVFLTIDNTKVNASLVNFPVAISVEDSFGDTIFNDLGDSGRKKIQVTTVIGGEVEQLYVEIAYWNAASKKGAIWVKVPYISSGTDTVLRFVYIADSDDNTDYVGDTGSVPAENVWDNNYVGVWHLDDTSIQDSTGTNLDGTLHTSASITHVPSIDLGNSLYSPNVTYAIQVPSFVGVGSNNTLEFIMKPTGIGSGAWANIVIAFNPTNETIVYNWHSYSSDKTLRGNYGTSTFTIQQNEVAYIAATSEVANNRRVLFKNGNQNTITAGTYSSSAATLYISGNPNRSYYVYNGYIGDVRISETTRSDAWIKAAYHSDYGDLISYGTPVFI